ncbi:MAG: DUF1778 domain-containing protein [Phycisphaerales bacterium]|nr:MAG: DUF1778 domain-containing protein [Phycisphaerales bacterium]
MKRTEKDKRTARLEARLTPAAYSLVQRAALLEGRSVSDFVVRAAQEAAAKTIQQSEVVLLSTKDQERFAAALIEPVEVTHSMKRAAAAHRNLIQRS